MTRIRVVQVVGSLTLGGAERVALELAGGLAGAGAGWAPEILCAGPSVSAASPGASEFDRSIDAEAAQRGVPVHRIPFGGPFDRAGRRALMEFLRSGPRPLAVHIHNRPQDWQIVPLCRLARVPVVFTVHSPYPLSNWRQRLLRVVTARLCPKVICVSRAVADHMRKSEMIPDSRIEVIYNGIRADLFAAPDEATRSAKREEMGWAAGEFIWIAAARLSEHKGLEYAIEAVARLGPGSRARLVVAGDGPERKKLQETAARANLGPARDISGRPGRCGWTVGRGRRIHLRFAAGRASPGATGSHEREPAGCGATAHRH